MTFQYITNTIAIFSFPEIGEINISEFFSNMFPILFGGLITYGTILITERIRKKNEIKNEKKSLYYGICAAIISYIRHAENVLRLSTRMYYFQRKYTLSKSDSNDENLNKEQYLLLVSQMLEAKRMRAEAANLIDSYTTKYNTMYGEDNKFESLLDGIRFPRKPDTNVFKNISDKKELYLALNEKMSEISTFRERLRKRHLDDLKEYLKLNFKI